MTIARWRLLGLLAGAVAVVWTFEVPPPSVVAATDAIDDVITGSIDPSGLVPDETGGSAAFRAGLTLLSEGHPSDAYEAAAALPDPLERKTLQWSAISYGNGAVPYQAVLAFAKEAPGLAATSTFKTRLEQALIKAEAPGAEIIKYLGGAMPNTLDAQIALALAYSEADQVARAQRIARDIWVNQFLDKGTEKKVLDALGGLLTPADHWARASHLMMHDRASGVERLLDYLTPAQQTLAVARNAVSRNAANAKALLDAVDPSYKTDPIYYFSRAQRARQFDLWDDAIAYLDKGKLTDPDAEEWWYERRSLIRNLLAISDVKRAYRAAANYTVGPEGRLVEAHFHAGWIALSFLQDAPSAVKQFTAMAKISTLPDSVSQAWYWLGRAKATAGDADGAKAAYTEAAQHGTIYYGLLAREALGLEPVALRDLPDWTSEETDFYALEPVRAVKLLAANGRTSYAQAMLRAAMPSFQSGGQLVLAARLAQSINAHALAIVIADTADKRGTPLDLFSFPKDGLPLKHLAEVDMAAIYAIARQESRFQVDAVSSSGARGLMQLMPATAKETAKKVGVPYSQSKLTTDGAYNALLGSTYLANQLQSYDGSLVLAAAAYNAGAGNANKWIAAYGDPRSPKIDPVVWVELIPFQETRRYVQRVLGNYLVYRARLGREDMSLTTALRRIAG